MSWFDDVASVLGVPAGAATLATAIYAGCVAGEANASKVA